MLLPRAPVSRFAAQLDGLTQSRVLPSVPPQTQFAARGGGYLHCGFAIPNNAGLVGVVIDW